MIGADLGALFMRINARLSGVSSALGNWSMIGTNARMPLSLLLLELPMGFLLSEVKG